MKGWIGLGLALCSALATAAGLETATNAQLLQELGRRLDTAEPAGQGAQAIYSCRSAYLYIHLTNEAGTTTEKYFSLSNVETCGRQSETLNRHRRRVPHTTVVAICRGSYLYRQPLLRNGTFGTDTYTSVDSDAACLAQAQLINTGR